MLHLPLRRGFHTGAREAHKNDDQQQLDENGEVLHPGAALHLDRVHGGECRQEE